MSRYDILIGKPAPAEVSDTGSLTVDKLKAMIRDMEAHLQRVGEQTVSIAGEVFNFMDYSDSWHDTHLGQRRFEYSIRFCDLEPDQFSRLSHTSGETVLINSAHGVITFERSFAINSSMETQFPDSAIYTINFLSEMKSERRSPYE